MNLYIAGKWESQGRLQVMRDRIHQETPHRVISTWLTETMRAYHLADHEEERQLAYRDYVEVKQSHILILDTLDEMSRGGRDVEWGIALGKGFMARWRVGPPRNFFHRMAQYSFESWDEAIAALRVVRRP